MSVRHDWNEITFAPATLDFFSRIVRFLADAGLPTEDLNPTRMSNFEVALDQTGEIVGVAGLDVSEGNALLRSVVVAKHWRRKGLGRQLVARRETAARQAGVGTIYLLTETSDDIFRHLGYEDVPRASVPDAISSHTQFRTLCSVSAKCLAKRL